MLVIYYNRLVAAFDFPQLGFDAMVLIFPTAQWIGTTVCRAVVFVGLCRLDGESPAPTEVALAFTCVTHKHRAVVYNMLNTVRHSSNRRDLCYASYLLSHIFYIVDI